MLSIVIIIEYIRTILIIRPAKVTFLQRFLQFLQLFLQFAFLLYFFVLDECFIWPYRNLKLYSTNI